MKSFKQEIMTSDWGCISEVKKKGKKKRKKRKEKKRNSDLNCGPYTRHAEKGILYSFIILSIYYVPVTCLAQSYVLVTKVNMVQFQALGSLESNGRFDQ